MYEEAKRESEREKAESDSERETETTSKKESGAQNTAQRTEAWRNDPRAKSASRTLLDSQTRGVKPETSSSPGVKPPGVKPPGVKPETSSQGVKPPARDSPDNALSSSKMVSVSSAKHREPHATAEKPTNNPMSQKQPHKQAQAPRSLKQAASTNNLATDRPHTDRKNPLNVKRVSSSIDPRVRVSTAAPRVTGGLRAPVNPPGARKLTDNAGGKGRLGEAVRDVEGDKTKEHRLSLPSEKIRLPSQRGERGPPTIPQEVGDGRAGLHRQNAVDKKSSEVSKTKTSAKQRPVLDSSPYAVSDYPSIITYTTLYCMCDAHMYVDLDFLVYCLCLKV